MIVDYAALLHRVRTAWAGAEGAADRLAELDMDPARLKAIIDGELAPSSTDVALISIACQVSDAWLTHGAEPRYIGPICGCPNEWLAQVGSHHRQCPLRAPTLPDVHPTSEPYAYQQPPAFTWAESVASHGIGPTAVIDIDIHAPGRDEPVPVEIPLSEARTLHAMLSGVLDEHDEHAPTGPDPAANPLREAVTAALRTTPVSADWPASSPHDTRPGSRDGHAYDARCALCAGDVAALTQAVMGVRGRETERLRGERDAAVARLAAVRALGNRLAEATEPFARAWGEELLGRVGEGASWPTAGPARRDA